MFPLNIIIRRLRPCVVSRSFIHWYITAPRHGQPFPAACFRGLTVNQPGLRGVVRRSLFLSPTTKVESRCPSSRCPSSRCPSSRCLSTSSHTEEGKLIYTGSIGNAVRGVKMFSYTSSGFSLSMMPYILLKTNLGIQSFSLQVAFCGIMGFFTFLTPVLLHVLTKGYVVRLYHDADRDTYTAITYNAFLMEKRNVFHQKQVRVPAVSKMFTSFYAGDTGLLVNPDLFPLPCDYNHLMGYDQPFSFNMDDLEKPDGS